MFIETRLGCFLLMTLLCAASVSARQNGPLTQAGSRKIYLDVVVSPKSGPPVAGLQQQDFALLDNKVPQTITSFRAVDGRQGPIEVILLVDAVNTGFEGVAYERGEIEKFLRAEGGNLDHPTALAVLTDAGIQMQEGFSIDGDALSASLEQYIIGLRTVRRSTGFYGAAEQFQLSLKGLDELLAREASRSGRKIILWVSPGWPLLSGANVELGLKEKQQLFAEIVSLSTQFLQTRVTLYSIDPSGANESGGLRTSYWKDFMKGISNPGQVHAGDLGLEVLATHVLAQPEMEKRRFPLMKIPPLRGGDF